MTISSNTLITFDTYIICAFHLSYLEQHLFYLEQHSVSRIIPWYLFKGGRPEPILELAS